MSVLQDMTKDIMSNKAAKASKLTPVAGESAMTVAMSATTLPNDVGVFMSNEVLINHAKALRKFAEDAIAIADGIDAMASSPTLSPSSQPVDNRASDAEERKRAEREADARAAAADGGSIEQFKERLDRLSSEAQASVFTAADDNGEAPAPSGWACPEHGSSNLVTLTPRKGDPYIMCAVGDCEEFEK